MSETAFSRPKPDIPLLMSPHENGGLAEVQTPSDNFAAIAVFEAVGLRLRRAEYVFHLWLD
jgi:hypothetical protein